MTVPSHRRKAPHRQVLADYAYDRLLALLVDGQFPAGSSLNIDALSRGLEVSQSPVREALARLESTGLVRRAALKGYSVAPILSTNELLELMDARLVLEPVNAFLSCEQGDERLIDELNKSVSALENAPRGRTFEEFRAYWRADEQFHQLIAEAAHNRFLLSAYSALGGQVQRFRLFAGPGVTDADHAIREHGLIRDAFVAGDADLARQSMVDHLNGVKSRALAESVRLKPG